MLITLLIGFLAAVVLLLLVNFAQKNKIKVQWWHWLLTVLGLLFAVFTAEALHVLLGEGAAQGALVTGLILGLVAVIWFVLLGRFVFAKR
ncbi:MAG: hypothetical protein WEE20_06185 [Bacteroidota bacterium]